MKYLYTIITITILTSTLFIGISTINAQSTAPTLPTSPTATNSTTQCPTCSTGQVCVKSSTGSLVCKETATNCSPACTGGKVCIKATATSTTGICVDDAPASAKGNTGGSGTNTGTASPTGLRQGLESFKGANSGLNTTGTLISYVATIIRWTLGLLGTVFFVIIVIQGFLYMTSSGDASKASAAISAITNAVIGLIIIMGAFLITNYVTSALTTGVGSGPTSPTAPTPPTSPTPPTK